MAATPPSVRLAPPVAPDVLDTEDEVELELALDAAELSTEVVPEEDAPVDAAELTAEAAEEASVTPLPSAAQFVVYSAHEQVSTRSQIEQTKRTVIRRLRLCCNIATGVRTDAREARSEVGRDARSAQALRVVGCVTGV